MNAVKKTCALITVLFCATVLNADEPQIMNQVRENYSPNSTIHAQFDHSIYWAIREREEKKSGELFVAPGNNFKVTLGNDVFVGDGETYWQYSKRNSQVLIYNLSDIDISYQPSNMLSSYLTERSFTQIGEEEGLLVLQSTEEDQNYQSIKAWVNKNNGTVSKLELIDNNENINTYTFHKKVFDKSIPSNTFRFNIPRNTDIQDMR